MLNKKFSLSSAFVLGFILPLLASCASTPAAHVGESSTNTEVEKGITLTQTDNRYLLPNGKIAGQNSALIQATAMVTKIDSKARVLTLKTEQSEPVDVAAGAEIRNFAQIKVGDMVKVAYMITVAFEVRQPTADELAADGSALEISARAKLGEMPAAGKTTAAVTIAKITAIDKTAGTVTIQKVATGTSMQITAQYPQNLSYAKVGDSVVITSMQAVAASVERI